MNLIAKINGCAPLCMHNGAGANPLDSREMPAFLQKKFGVKTFREAEKGLSTKRGKTDSDHKNLSVLGFYGSLYLVKETIVYPAKCLKAAIVTQAKHFKLGQQAKRAVSILLDAPLEFPNSKKGLDKLYDLHKYIEPVKVGQAKVVRTRAIFPIWSLEFKIQLVDKILNKQSLKEILEQGEFYGSLERRPDFGKYKLVSLK